MFDDRLFRLLLGQHYIDFEIMNQASTIKITRPENHPLMVHEEEGQVVAWVSFQAFYARAAYDHTAEISIYISPGCRGKGLGKTLLAEALGNTRQLGIKTIVGFVFSHNEPSIRLFRSFGFAEWGILPEVAEMDGREYSLTILGKRVNR